MTPVIPLRSVPRARLRHCRRAGLLLVLCALLLALNQRMSAQDPGPEGGVLRGDTTRPTTAPADTASDTAAFMPLRVTKHPEDVTVTAFADANFTVNYIGLPEPSVEWQFSPDGSFWADIPGATTGLLTVRSAVMSHNGTKWRARLKSPIETIYSNPATLTVRKAQAVVQLDGLAQSYDGTPRRVHVSVTPPDVRVVVTYKRDGTVVPMPVEVGSYDVSVVVDDRNYEGSATGTLVISQ